MHADDVGDDGDTGFETVATGPVTVDELAGTGTALGNYVSSVACDSGKGSANGTSHTFSVDFGDQVTCTITNTRKGKIVVEKQVVNDNGGTALASAWTMNVSGPTNLSFAGSAAGVSNEVLPGSFTVGESGGPGGYALTYPTGGLPAGVAANDCDTQGQVSVGPGQTKHCVLRNDDIAPKLIVIKHVINDDGGTAVAGDFQMTVDDPGANPPSFPGAEAPGTEVVVDAGAYSVSEFGPSGYAPSFSADCAGSLALAETKTCTVTNNDLPGTLVVIKHVVNDNGGSAVASAWTMNVAGPTPLSFAGAEAPGTSNPVDAGAYKVTESGGPAGYALSYSGDCDADGDVTVPLGQTRTCILTNDDVLAKLIVIKHVVNDDGGTAVAGDFQMTVDDPGANPPSFPGAEAPGTDVPVDPGAYSVSEGGPAGYAASFSADCAGTIALGETKTCTVTNNDQPGTLIVIKHVVNDNGGSAAASAWTMNVAGPTPLSFAGAEAPGTSNSVDAGAYKVTESGGPAGYALSYSGDCDADGDVTVALGQTRTCILTNNDLPGTLVVIKHVVNDNGGSAVASAWTMNVAGPTPLSFAGAEAPGTSNPVDAGAYKVTESGGPAGYALSYSGDCDADGDVTVPLGQTRTCILTNDDVLAKLIVIKHVVNDDGGTAVAGDFQMTVDDPGANPPSFPGAEAPGTDVPVDPGAYSVSEGGPAGYAASFSADCAGTIALGETKTCTVTNNDQPGTLIVIKHVVNDNGGSAAASAWTMNVAGPTPLSFAGAEAPGTSNSVDAGAYKVTESGGPAGYALSYSGDCDADGDVTVALGQTRTCVLTNTKLPRGAINVIKTANPTSVKEPGGPVNFTVTVENTGRGERHDQLGGRRQVRQPRERGRRLAERLLRGAVRAHAGRRARRARSRRTCPATAGTSHVNVVTASGVDTSQNPVSDSDDATVTFTERLIDLVIVKDATSPTPLNEIVTYTMTVTNKGPDTATNVQLADPAPAGIRYISVVPGSPTCTVTPALLTCSLGTLEVGQSRTITLTARATVVGRHTNTATVTGSGGRETNPADNVDTAVTVVPQPAVPPTPKPKPTYCLTLTVTPKMITADGRPDTVKVKTTAGPKRVKGTMVRIKGAGVKKSARSNARGIATLRINPKRPGVLTITAVETKNQQVCGPRRIGAVGVFLPPLTG